MAVRILQVFGAMNRGGAETWMMNVLRAINRQAYQIDFLVHDPKPGIFDEEIKSLGSSIYYCQAPKKPIRYARHLKRILSDHGPYDVIHSHVHHYSGWILRVAQKEKIKTRIAHSHSDTRSVQVSARRFRRVYLWLTSKLIAKYSTHGLACSKEAAPALFGAGWENDQRWKVLFYGLDLAPFQFFPNRTSVRKELSIPENSLVIGHVGRFVKAKNHSFIIEIAEKLLKLEPEILFLLIGDGPEYSDIKEKVEKSNLKDHIIFAGTRPDIPRLMMGAMNVFLFPSLYEGLPISFIEAQSAGLPCIISDVISREADIVEEKIIRLSLLDSPSLWADVIYKQLRVQPNFNNQKALEKVANSEFTIEKSVRGLMKAYDRSAP